jgi:succinate dehydrogenase flavin-adding protein (antitoxin of CptAB toxin-antitoxin module)
MKIIEIYEHSLVIVAGDRKTDYERLFDQDHGQIYNWDVNSPEKSREELKAIIDADQKAMVTIINAHRKSVQDAVALAKKHGLMAHVMTIGKTADISSGAGKADSFDKLEDERVFFQKKKMPSDKSDIQGPFDLIGDIHGVADELEDLLIKLGHMDENKNPVNHPKGRIPVFLGDYTDRGPKNKRVLELVKTYTQMGGIAILGNHDYKLMRWLEGRNVNVAAGIAVTIEELSRESDEWKAEMAQWLKSLQSHYTLANEALIVAHAGLEEAMHGRHTQGAMNMAMYGKPVEGGTVLDEDGYPLAEDWAQNYSGKADVVHGHVVYDTPREVNNVYAVDTGAVFGGSLTALQWPEKTYVSVPARKRYFSHPKIKKEPNQ